MALQYLAALRHPPPLTDSQRPIHTRSSDLHPGGTEWAHKCSTSKIHILLLILPVLVSVVGLLQKSLTGNMKQVSI